MSGQPGAGTATHGQPHSGRQLPGQQRPACVPAGKVGQSLERHVAAGAHGRSRDRQRGDSDDAVHQPDRLDTHTGQLRKQRSSQIHI
jgi:hypothetical protein